MKELGVIPSQHSDLVHILDPSDKFRPEKDAAQFRDFTANTLYFERVRRTYGNMHTHQTYEFARSKLESWTRFNHAEIGIMDALEMLDALVDESDPDVDIPNSVHAFQTAERIREQHPNHDWFHLVGLIHDVGKVMAMWGEPQWCVVGDTFPVGCAPAEEVVFGRESFSENPDIKHPIYGSKLGIYEENCGLESVTMSWGHDEYMYRVLKGHEACSLPEVGLNIIRFHSFYPWHTAGAYRHLTNEQDEKNLRWVLEFNNFDLYSKADKTPDMAELKVYYQSLIDKYIPGKLRW